MADRYEIKGRLGKGGIGAVYQAHDNHLGQEKYGDRRLARNVQNTGTGAW